jgi:2-keto-4-pentenoate hydratase/2-oxohepta-3-ene-1,7-dioic acid hydratase in catechol pathway
MPTYGRFLVHGKPQYAEIKSTADGEVAHFIHDLFERRQYTGDTAPVASLHILPPVNPRKIFAIGLNYADHAAESGKAIPEVPLMWFKAPTALIAHGEAVEVAYPDHRTDYEAELVIVIGRGGKHIPESHAAEHILGYTCGQDISDRVVQRSESQWARAKSMDTYAPLGPYITTGVEVNNWQVECLLNGQVKQSASTDVMIFSPEKLVAFLSKSITLEPGDVIYTGTPEGVGPVKDGDVIETRIGPLTSLVNPVKFLK